MKVIIVDDDAFYARALGERIAGAGDVHAPAVRGLSVEDAAESLKDELANYDGVREQLKKGVQDGQETELAFPQVVLINREARLQNQLRQKAPGLAIYRRLTWRYPLVPFYLYSFQPTSEELCEVTCRLPFDGTLPSLSLATHLGHKVNACLRHMDEVFPRIQHGLKDAGATVVNIARLLVGAIQNNAIQTADQALNLAEALPQEENLRRQVSEIEDPTYGLVELLELQRLVAPATDPVQPVTLARKIIMVDDETEDSTSPWTRALSIIYHDSDFTFETLLPSAVDADLRKVEDADLILLDVNYERDPGYQGKDPKFGGRHLLERIHRAYPDIPVVMLSAYDDAGLAKECLRLGAYDYLTKSWGAYTRFRVGGSQKEWFQEWDRVIMTPLRFRPFFRDLRTLRRRGFINQTSVEEVTDALKHVEAPTTRDLKVLAVFFEEFVVNLLAYEGEEVGNSLYDCLDTDLIGAHENIFPHGHLLRVLRNSVVHSSSGMAWKYNTWLFLLLLRSFILRHTRSSDLTYTAWMEPLIARFAWALKELSLPADARFFRKSGGGVSKANAGFLARRKGALRTLQMSQELSADDFRFHTEALITSLASGLPREILEENRLGIDDLGNLSQVDKLANEISNQTKEGGRFAQGYESLAAIGWLLDNRVRNLLAIGPDREDLNRLRWVLASHGWLWYTSRLFGQPNDVMFTGAIGITKVVPARVYAKPQEILWKYFVSRKLFAYLPYYVLRIGYYHLSKALRERAGEMQGEVERLTDQLHQAKEELAARNKELEDLQGEKAALESDLQREIEELVEKIGRIDNYLAEGYQKRIRSGTKVQSPKKTLEARDKLQLDRKKLEEEMHHQMRLVRTKTDKASEDVRQREDKIEALSEQRAEYEDLLSSIEREKTHPYRFPDDPDTLTEAVLEKAVVFQRICGLPELDLSEWVEWVRGLGVPVPMDEVEQKLRQVTSALFQLISNE